MNSIKQLSGWQFSTFRFLFGIYLAWHFAALIPYGPELFSAAGVLPEASLNFTYVVFPNLLAWADAPWQTQAFLGLLALASVGLAIGWQRRTCALLLWYGWACLFNRNNLISNPGIPYVGLLLVFCAIVPRGEPLSWQRAPNEKWQMPAFVYWGAWFLLAIGYSYSGVWKLLSPSWQDGSALWHLLMNPLSRPGISRDVLLDLPWPFLTGLTWVSLVGELSFLPLSLNRKGRMVAWTWMLCMHLGILLVVDFADLTFGMLMIHLFTFDPDWFPARIKSAIFLFDGKCGFCNRAVQFFREEDRFGVLNYAPLEGKIGQNILRRHGLTGINSMVLVENFQKDDERVHAFSTAAIRALMIIGGFWRLATVGLLIPKSIRDAMYRTFAARRYKMFSPDSDTCLLPIAPFPGSFDQNPGG